MGGYQQLEERSLPRYQKGTPIMSKMEVVCRAQVIVQPKDEHPPLDFMVTYDRIWDVTVYPTYPKTPRKYPKEKWCKNGISTQIITNTGIGGLYTKLEPEYKYDTRNRYNLDPSKGAVRVWRLPRVQIDGLNYLATMVTFVPMIVEGDKLPTNSWFSRDKFTSDPHTKKETIFINGREWQYMVWQIVDNIDISEQGGPKTRDSSTVDELYTTQIGDYLFVMVGSYSSDLATHAPDWVVQRQLYLRHWLASFKFEPISQRK
jgi:hypothetical protein